MPKRKSRVFCALILVAGLCFSGNIQAANNNSAAEENADMLQQKRSIKGNVTDAYGPVIGASVQVQGTLTGTITDASGNFTIDVSDGQTLVISYLGYVTQEIAITNQTALDVRLQEDTQALGEVVVTALGISREKKTLGYAVQEIKGGVILESRETNVTNALSGKISGLQVIRSSNGASGSSKIVLRGSSSLTGDNQPLIVVDGVPMENNAGATNNDPWYPAADMGNGLSDINPEDIESMSVLKGGSAAALYGSRAGSGVILITTKTGRRTDGVGITVSSTTAFETIFMLPEIQTSFGQGTRGIFDPLSGLSWGPRIEGQEITNWDGKKEKMAAYDNVRNYAGMGLNQTETITFQQQYGKSSIYTSLTRMDDRSKVPGSSYNRTNMTARAVSVFGKDDRWRADTKVQYIRSDATNRPTNGINSENPFWTAYNLPRSMDIRDFKESMTDKYGQMIWYTRGATAQVNPYWLNEYKTNTDVKDRFLLSGSLKYKFAEWLDAEIRGGTDMYTTTSENKLHGGSPVRANGSYAFGHSVFSESNYSFLISARKDNLINKLGGAASFGGNLMSRKFTNVRGTANDLVVPNLFSINNALNKPVIDEGFSRKKINSLYGTAQVNWDGYLFVDATFRNDWSSALSKANRSFFYPSLSLSYVFSDMADRMGMSLPSWMTFAKLRASIAQVGNDMKEYQLYNTYVIGLDPEGHTVAYSRDVLYDPNVKSELITTSEIGAEMRFFNNRLGLDFAWYKTNATNQLIDLPMDSHSGYLYKKMNAGDIQNQGIELMANARIIELANSFAWDAMVNFSVNRNTIVSLGEGITQYSLGGYDNVHVLAVAGGDYGEIFGTTFLRVTDPASPHYGKIIVDENGIPQSDPVEKKLGTQQASSLMGITNSFAFKGFSLNFLVDCRFGGEMFSGTNAIMLLNGTGAASAPGGKRDNFIFDGVVASGDGYVPNTKEITQQDYVTNLINGGVNFGTVEKNMYDATNIRLRNVQLSYSFAKQRLAKTPFQQVKLGVSCNNVWMISSHLNGVDPESVFATGSNATGFENGSAPTSRTFLFNLTLGF